MDIEMPVMGGEEATRKAREKIPGFKGSGPYHARREGLLQPP